VSETTSFLGAAASADITPPAGLRMGGYAARGDALATGTHDPLQAVIVWLRQVAEPREVVFVVLDALAVDVKLAGTLASAVAAELGCGADSVHVSATHTHSGPAGWFRDPLGRHLFESGGASREDLVAKVAAAARSLPDTLEPVTVGFAEGPVHGLGSNRDHVHGSFDPSLGLLALQDAGGRFVAVVADHGCHPTVLGHANTSWSADWPGATRRRLQAELPGNPVVAVLQGASGDVSARFTRRAQTFAEMERLGGVAATAAADILPRLERQRGIVALRSRLKVPTRTRPDPAAAKEAAVAAEREWRRVVAGVGPGPEERIARTRHEGALITLEMAERGLPATVELPLGAFAVGETAYVEVPVELFSSPALAIRRGSPFRHTRIVGLAGGCFGYVADAAAHEAGVYEALASPFDAGAAQLIVDEAHALLERVYDAARKEEPWPMATR
jgi:neutral/alkaline ceramidase-like enzyme